MKEDRGVQCDPEKCVGMVSVHGEVQRLCGEFCGFRKTIYALLSVLMLVSGLGWVIHATFADKLTIALIGQGTLTESVKNIKEDVRELRRWTTKKGGG